MVTTTGWLRFFVGAGRFERRPPAPKAVRWLAAGKPFSAICISGDYKGLLNAGVLW